MAHFSYLFHIKKRSWWIAVVLASAACVPLQKSTSDLTPESHVTRAHSKADHTHSRAGNAQAFEYAAVFSDPSVFSDSASAHQKGAVATVNPHATQAALNAFHAGGNAIDAALAAAFTLGVVDSHNSGIGGGCFILVRLADGRVLALDGRETAPLGVTPETFVQDGKVQSQWSRTGALAVGIPGSVAAYAQLQALAGKLSWSQVILPAANLADSGFEIDRTLSMRLQHVKSELQQFPPSAQIYLTPEGEAPVAGYHLRQTDLANSYRALAQQGADWFYRGEFAEKLAAWMKTHGGLITREDLESYRVIERTPLVTEFKGYQVYGFPSPSSGGTHVAQMLAMLNELEIEKRSETEFYHLLAEVMRLAFADRANWMGDADFVPVPKGLLSERYLKERVKLIDQTRAAAHVSHGVPDDAETLFDKHTTHIAVADAEGNWVAITTTVNTSFGSKVVIPGTGILLNNQMNDFSLDPNTENAFGLIGAHANQVAPGKRPLSSMSPTLVFKDGEPVMTLGAAGGPTIISQVTQVLLRHLALKQPLSDAMKAPRIHHQWSPNILFIEDSAPEAVKLDLQKKGHELKSLGSFGGTQAIVKDGNQFIPMTEPRVIERNRAP